MKHGKWWRSLCILALVVCYGCGKSEPAPPPPVDTVDLYTKLDDEIKKAQEAQASDEIEKAYKHFKKAAELGEQYVDNASVDDALFDIGSAMKDEADEGVKKLEPKVSARRQTARAAKLAEEDALSGTTGDEKKSSSEGEEKDETKPSSSRSKPTAQKDTTLAADQFSTPVTVESVKAQGEWVICRFVLSNKNTATLRVGAINVDYIDAAGTAYPMFSRLFYADGFSVSGDEPQGKEIGRDELRIGPRIAPRLVAVAPKPEEKIVKARVLVGFTDGSSELRGEGP